MDFTFTAEHEQVRRAVREFAAREILPYIKENDRKQTFDRSLLPKMAAAGLLGISVPVRYGGAGFDYISLGIVAEELEYADTSARVIISVHNALNSLGVFQWGTEEQKQMFLVPQARGEKIAAFCLTEPGAGTDVAALRSVARRDGSDYIISGEKTWISLADVADHFLWFAKTDPHADPPHKGITAFMITRDMKGVTTGTIHGKLGVRAGNTGWVHCDEVRVPASHRIGFEGEGFKIAMSCLDNGRYTVAAGALGLTRAALDASLAYARSRKTFGVEIGQHQLVKRMISLMVQRVEIGRLLVYRAGWMKNMGMRNTRETALAKWYCTDASFESASDAIQIHGAYGYSDEYDVERFLRNSKGAVIYEGTRELQQLLQADYALGYREDKPLRCELPAYDPVYWQSEA
ncbi:MAG: acyl-CoA dehydrogenase family protein [Anaerolineae bacterium]|nr:acyl-CoA dehydrogenase family protein [Caldilineales bacterium]MCX7853456.1 acyl-CoA dehydrogenase family protein [Caldilineales bacterium]MDW8268663.1 acyl-CoA dehydrogenase family protein [Anaerolineae bacterium]